MALVLIVDNDLPVRRFVRIALGANGHMVIETERLPPIFELYHGRIPDLLILGAAYDDELRAQAARTAAGLGVGRVIGLRPSAGSRDKAPLPEEAVPLIRPFSIGDLLAAVSGSLDGVDRRPDDLHWAGVRMDFTRHVVTRSGAEVRLSRMEYDILLCLAARHDSVLSERQIIETVWGTAEPSRLRRLRLYIERLRKKLEEYPRFPDMLMTVPGQGYRLRTVAGDGRRYARRPPAIRRER